MLFILQQKVVLLQLFYKGANIIMVLKREKLRSANYWGAVILDWFEELNRLDLNRSDYRTLFFICSQMESQTNTAHIKQIMIAKDLKMDKGNVSKSIKNLIDLQFIVKTESGFMVNPHLFYVGKARAEDRALLRKNFDDYVIDSGESTIYFMDESEAKLINISLVSREIHEVIEKDDDHLLF